MNAETILQRNRVILCHFDSYSCALNFARYGDSVLAPEPLPASAVETDPPGDADAQHEPATVLDALVVRYALNPAQLAIDDGFEAWLSGETGPIRVHLVRIASPDIPHETIEPMGAVFKPISQMRGMPATELNLMRQVFNLIMSG